MQCFSLGYTCQTNCLHPGSTVYNHDGLRHTVLFFPAFLAFLTRKINYAVKRINENLEVKETTLQHRLDLQILLPFYLFLKHSTFLSFCLCALVRVFSELWIWGSFSLSIYPLKDQGWQYLFPCTENINKPQPGLPLIIYTRSHIMCICNKWFTASH